MQWVVKKVDRKVLLLFIIGFLVFGNSLFNGFVWDDFDQVVRNTAVHSITNFSYFFSGSHFYTGGAEKIIGFYYKPLLPMSSALIYSLFGGTAFSFHLVQVALHIVNTMLLYFFFKGFIPRKVSFFAALAFLIHPIQAESVVYISARQEVLYFFFGITGLLLLRQGLKEKNDHKRYILLAFVSVFLFLSLLSKETGLLFLVVSFFYMFLFYRKHFLPVLLTLVSVSLVYFILRFGIAQVFFRGEGLAPILRATLQERLLTLPKALFYYIKTFFVPIDLSIAQNWVIRIPTFEDFYLPVMILVIFFLILGYAGVALTRLNKESSKRYWFFFAWFLLGLGLHSQIVPLDMTVAERWFYFPIVGLLGMFAVFLTTVPLPKTKKLKIYYLTLFIMISILLASRTIIRNTNWKSIFTLYVHDIQISKDSFDLENNYGVALYRMRHYAQAKIHFQKSVELAPYWYTNWHNLGLIYEYEGDSKRAKEYYKKAINNSGVYFAYESLARIYLLNGEYKEAIQIAQDALSLYKRNDALWRIVALSEYKLGRKEKALEAAQNMYKISDSEFNKFVYTSMQKGKTLDPKKLYRFY